MLSRLTRPQAVAVCALPVVALVATALFAPLPFSLAQPGMTANVLGKNEGAAVITISGARTRATSGQLRMTTIEATGPDTRVSLGDIVDSWFRTDQAVMPHDAVYPSGQSVKEIEEHNTAQMKESQDAATEAALGYLKLSADKVKVTLKLADVGGRARGCCSPWGSSTSSTVTAPGAISRAAAPSPGPARSTRTARWARWAAWH